MLKNKFYKDTLKTLALIVAVMLACKFTYGGMAIVVALVGAAAAMQRKSGIAAACYAMFPFFMIFNRKLVGISSVFLMTSRFGVLFMIAVLMLTGIAFTGRAREKLPIGWMFAYCFVACLSSIDGWMPMISFLKIAQFVLFIIGLMLVAHVLQQSDKGLYQVRCFFMAISIIFTLGSAALYFIPSVGYSMQLSSPWLEGMTQDQILKEVPQLLFNGMTYHSQQLAPSVAMAATWILCDMILVEKKVGWLHLACLVVTPILLYMSRSRGGLLDIVAVMTVVVLVCVPKARLKRAVKGKLFNLMVFAVVVMVGVAFVSQARNQSISKWLRKVDDVGGDNRTLKDAFTGSRQPLVEANMYDFKLNPMLGKGFQVVPGMEQAYRAGMITLYSAPVEKGVTPYVILGETGIVGAGVFTIFLLVFYATCLKRRYLALLTSFTCVLTANLADSSLFSPSGGGGFMWIVSCVGAFSTDLIAIRTARREQVSYYGLPPPPR